MLIISRILAATALALVAGCSVLGGGRSLPASGLVVADEPNAVQAGADVLAHGGDAADAAAATYFALAVTYPVSAGLGGGGLCIVYDAQRASAETFEFLPREPKQGGAYAVPGNVKGFSLLQNTYGLLPWQRVISQAEGFAAAGFTISHALAVRLESGKDVIRLDAGLSAEFLDEAGQVKPAGTLVTAPALAQTLAQIRTGGPQAFYRGPIAESLVAYSQSQGGAISSDDLASYESRLSPPATIKFGDQIAYLPPAKIGAGKFAGLLFHKLLDAGSATRETTIAGVPAVTRSVLDAFGIASLPRDLGATGFAVEDSNGLAVACAVTMDGPFGSGHTAGGTGVILAADPDAGQNGLASAFLTPVIAASGSSVSLAGAAAGGPNGTAAIGSALVELARGDDLVKPGTLHSTGIAPYDTVNVIGCRSGLCAAIPDPGAYGLGAAAPP